MDYERLTKSYWDEQVARVITLRDKINERDQALSVGRVVPEDEDLTIGTGRRLDMAVMFLDLCSFSGRPSETVPEQEMMLKVLNLFFTEMVKIAEEYGGVVEKNTGELADQKAAFLCAGVGATVAFLHEKGVTKLWLQNPDLWAPKHAVSFIATTNDCGWTGGVPPAGDPVRDD